jgi:hypothetical protein
MSDHPQNDLDAELARLAVQLDESRKRLEVAFHTEPRGDVAKAGRLGPCLEKAQEVLAILNRIKKLQGNS